MKLPQQKKILREELKGAAEWVGKLISPINTFMESVYNALNRNITLEDNIACQIKKIQFTTASDYISGVLDESNQTITGQKTFSNLVTTNGGLLLGPGSTTVPPLKFQEGDLLNTPQAGALEYENGHLYITNGARHVIDTSTGIKTSTTTVTNTTTETEIYSHTFAANEIHTDEFIEAIIGGSVSNASAADDYIIRVKINGSTIFTVNRVGGNVTNVGWQVNFNGTVRTSGASGTYVWSSRWTENNLSSSYAIVTPVSIDTTAAITFSITAQWAAAKLGNTISCTQGFLTFKH